MHEFMPLELFLVFLQQMCPFHFFQSKTQVLDGFTAFCCRTRPAAKISIGVHLKHEFVPRKPFLVWSQRTCPIHYIRSKTHVFDGFSPFRRRTRPVAETSIIARKQLMVLEAETTRNMSFRPTIVDWVCSLQKK